MRTKAALGSARRRALASSATMPASELVPSPGSGCVLGRQLTEFIEI
jgi:hypothetical protein